MISTLPTLSQAAEQVRSGSLSPIELVEFCLARIDRFEKDVRAWVLVDADGARRAAEESAKELKSGKWRGPLHGIPLGVKDIFDVAGFRTKAGSPLREKHLAERDCPVVARLRECGAIVLGKTVTTEFACFDPPVTRNPWNLAHTPGGSSSGSAAALAAQMCLLALGSQTGGSITRPAVFCGVVGIKPKYGSLPLEGIVPLAYHLDHPGMLARSADDLRVFWRTYQIRMVTQKAEELHLFWKAYQSADTMAIIPRLLKLEGYFWNEAAPEVREAADAALATLARNGAQIVPLDWPEITKVHDAHRRIITVEAAQYHQANYTANPSGYGRHIGALIAEGLSTSAVDYADALATQREFKRHLAEWLPTLKADAFVLPAASTTAPLADTTGDPKFHIPWSYSGLPAVNIPCSIAPNGLPCGLQLVGLSDEHKLLDTAAWCESQLGFRVVPTLLRQ